MSFNITTNNVENYANLASFPATGEENVLYLDNATNQLYFWNGSSYAASSASADYSTITGVQQITGTIVTAPILTGNVNNYNPTGFATSNMIRQNVNANNREITGIQAPSAGVNRVIYINNVNTGSFDIKFKNNNASSVAANRILLRDNSDKACKPNETASFWYDHSVSRWRAFNRVG